MFKRLFNAAIIFGAAAIAPPMAAHAQTAPTACAPRQAIVERLAERYTETRSGAGLQNASQMLEIYSSPETGSWTILITRADGVSCIVATGTNWFNSAPTMARMGVPG